MAFYTRNAHAAFLPVRILAQLMQCAFFSLILAFCIGPAEDATLSFRFIEKSYAAVLFPGEEQQPVRAKTAKGRTIAPEISAVSAPGTEIVASTSKSAASSKTTAPTTMAAERIPAAEPGKFPATQIQPFDIQKGGVLPLADTWLPLVGRLNKDGIEMDYLRAMFGRIGDSYSHEPMGSKINELFINKFVAKSPRKASVPKSTVPAVYKSMVTPESVTRCKAYLETHQAAFAGMEAQYGVPREIVASLLMVETRLGTYLGRTSSFWSLACMAAADMPHRVNATVRSLPLPMTPDKKEWLQKILRERSAWAYKELLALIKHSIANDLDPLGMPGSVYGAIGICQFMPSNLHKYAVDGNKDGKIDLFEPTDAIFSVGNYLKEHGWKGNDWRKKDRNNHHASLKRYNKSNIYANTILALADAIAAPPVDAVKPVNTTSVSAKPGGKKTSAKRAKAGPVLSSAKGENKKISTGKSKAQNAENRSAKKNPSAVSAKNAPASAKKAQPKPTAKIPARMEPAEQANPVSSSAPAESGTPPSAVDAAL